MAQTTLTIFAGDQLYKSVVFPLFSAFLDYKLEQLFHPINWNVCRPYPWGASLVYR
jgi:hypothetical protein